MTLTKAHIVEAPAERNDYPKKQSFDTVETLLENIKRTLESGEYVRFSGFGIIVHRRAAKDDEGEFFIAFR
jgi:integration host factor subunit alpha